MGYLRANQAFSYDDHNGVPHSVRPGDLFEDTDPAVKGRDALFEPIETALTRRRAAGVEEATAAPGTKRSVSTSKRGGKSSTPPSSVSSSSSTPPGA